MAVETRLDTFSVISLEFQFADEVIVAGDTLVSQTVISPLGPGECSVGPNICPGKRLKAWPIIL